MTVRSRKPRGTPAGGQFASQYRAESSLTLDNGADILVKAADSVKYWTSHTPTPSTPAMLDDLTQEVCLAYVSAMQRSATPISNSQGYIHRIARNAVHSGQGVVSSRTAYNRSEVRSAYTTLLDRTSAMEQQLGRSLSNTEIDAIAEEVRMDQPPRRRAFRGFHHAMRTTSAPIPEDLAATDTEAVHAEFGKGTAGYRAEILAERGNIKDARDLLWDALAEQSGAPGLVAGGITDAQFRSARRRLINAGGVAKALKAFQSGEAVDSLFVPFAVTSDTDREKIVDTLTQHGQLCDDIWRAAAGAAVKRQSANAPSA